MLISKQRWTHASTGQGIPKTVGKPLEIRARPRTDSYSHTTGGTNPDNFDFEQLASKTMNFCHLSLWYLVIAARVNKCMLLNTDLHSYLESIVSHVIS